MDALRRLSDARDAQGRKLEIVEFAAAAEPSVTIGRAGCLQSSY